jgi:uncharacterized protein YyaL (SSP411 family)
LINETSTYLLQHAHNPVDWYPWGEEALTRSTAEDKPILLSIGYSACHWCHVMEHESFEDEATAAIMNDQFICIKVDREERPDIDDIYMKAVQMLTGHGGWPMTVFLTPQLKPFFAGTYFPPQDRHGMPSFKRVLAGVTTAWKDQRDKVEGSSAEITSHLGLFDMIPEGSPEPTNRLIENSLSKLWHMFDSTWGGFGSAPKFPHASALTLITWNASEKSGQSEETVDRCYEMLSHTLDKMAFGGMYDQLGGGFARYSVDRQWLIPHFEKMLYDNAQLARNYLAGYQLTGRLYWAQIGRETLDFVLEEMTTPEGVFYSSLDADSEGVEGKYYAWQPAEVKAILGEQDGGWLCKVYGVTSAGNFEHGQSILHLTDSPEALAEQSELTEGQFWAKLNPLRAKLKAARQQRVKPGRDEKVLLSWSSLMISAFVDGYRILGDRKYLTVATRAAEFILHHMLKDGRLMRTFGRGEAKLKGYLDDYAYFVQSLLDLASVDFDDVWLEQASALTEVVLTHFADSKDGSLFYASDEHERLIARTKAFYDTSSPSPTAIVTMNLLRLASILGREDWKEHAAKLIGLYLPFFAKVPDQFASFITAVQCQMASPTEIVFVADTEGDGWEDMLLAIHKRLIPGAVIVLKEGGADHSKLIEKSPLLAERDLIDGSSAAYVCHNYTCEKPVTKVEELNRSLAPLALGI